MCMCVYVYIHTYTYTMVHYFVIKNDAFIATGTDLESIKKISQKGQMLCVYVFVSTKSMNSYLMETNLDTEEKLSYGKCQKGWGEAILVKVIRCKSSQVAQNKEVTRRI